MSRFDLELRVLLAFAFVNGVADSALVPLLPAIRADLGLSSGEVGLVLATTTLTMLATAIPIGNAANRFGTRALLLLAAVLMPLALAGQALADTLPALLAARLLFGISFGILWMIGPARAAANGRGAGGTGPLIAAAGAGWLVGPILAGGITDLADWRLACGILAAATASLIAVVARYAARGTSGESFESVRLGAALRLVRRNRTVAGAALVSALLGVVNGVSGLLVPLALADNGLSAGGIGLAFGISAAVWIASAALVGRLRASAVHFRGVGLVTAVLAGAWLIPAVQLSTLALVAFLVISAGCRSTINALVYAVGARVAGTSTPIVMSVMNLAWAVMALATPLVAGLANGAAGVRIAFAVTGVAALGVALVMLAPRARLTIGARPS